MPYIYGSQKHEANGGRNGTAVIKIKNLSTQVSDAAIRNYIPLINQQLTFHFSKDWAFSLCEFDNNPSTSDWIIEIKDGDGSGYHTVGGLGEPYGVATASPSRDWRNVLSHEVFEMSANPFVNTKSDWFLGATGIGGNRLFVWHEVSDQINQRPLFGSNTFSYHSDYVTQGWFKPPYNSQAIPVTRATSDSSGPIQLHQPGWLDVGGYCYIENELRDTVIINATGAQSLPSWNTEALSRLKLPEDCFWAESSDENPSQLLRATEAEKYLCTVCPADEVGHMANRLSRAGIELPPFERIEAFHK